MFIQFVATWLWGILPARLFSRPREAGQGLVEYAFILVLVALIVVIILAVVGTAVRDGLYENIIENI